ncbi:hypothetical protein HOG21_00810 [bacterium]|nr:hypothetical protein [bacterium]
MNKTNYCQSSFQDIVLLLNTLKAHFWCNEKKNKSVYDVLFYNRNLEIFLYPIEIIDINQFMEHLKANYDYLLKPYLQNSYKFEINLDDLDEYPYEIKVLYESETKKNNQKLKVVKLN